MLQWRAKLKKSKAIKAFVDKIMDAERYGDFCFTLAQHLPKRCDFTALYQSNTHLLSQKLTAATLRELIWRLCGNLEKLELGEAVPPWNRQPYDEWIPLQVISVRTLHEGHRTYAELKLQTVVGRCCPLQLTHQWSVSQLRYYATAFGFARRSAEHRRFVDVQQLVGMCFEGRVLASLSTGTPAFKDIRVLSGAKKLNRELIAKRERIGFDCPFNYEHACFRCPVGYDRCEVGTHPVSYEARYCSSCSKDSWFDPAANSDCCVECKMKGHSQ